LEKSLRPPAEAKGYKALGPFSERHGSWEMRFYKGNDLNRFTVFSVTPSLPSAEQASGHYDIEIWIGADRGKHYTRLLAWSYTIEDVQLIHKADRDQLRRLLVDGFERGMATADRITATDLTEAYLRDEAEERVA